MAIKITLHKQPFSVRIFEMVFQAVERPNGILYVNTRKTLEITDNLPAELQESGAVNKLLTLAKAHNLLEYTSPSLLESYPNRISRLAKVNIYCAPWYKFAKSGDKIQPFYDENEYRPLSAPEISEAWYVGFGLK